MSGELVAGIFALAAAVIAVAGTFAFNYHQLKRDGKTIDRIDGTTIKTQGTARNILKQTADIFKQAEKNASQLAVITEDMIRRQERDKANAESASNRDLIANAAQQLFNENASLRQQNAELVAQNKQLQEQVCNLQRELTRQQNRSQPKRTGYDDLEH